MQNRRQPPALTMTCEGYSNPSFHDGSLIIESGDNRFFRVHHYVLAHYPLSFVFYPAHSQHLEVAKVLPVFHVPESAKTISLVLRAIYDGLYTPSSTWTRERLEKVHKFACKYSCQLLVHRCYSLLAGILYPHDLENLAWTIPIPDTVRLAQRPSLEAESTFEFRVRGPRTRNAVTIRSHYGLLSRRSPVLWGIIEEQLTAGLGGHGSIFMELNEEPETVQEFLQALYFGFYFQTPTSSNLAQYTSVLKLAKQFQVAELRDEIKDQFRRAYPATLEAVHALDRDRTGPHYIEDVFDRPIAFQLLYIAQECNLIEVLRKAHFDLSRMRPEWEGIASDWSPPEKDWSLRLSERYNSRCQRARLAVKAIWVDFMRNLKASEHVTMRPSARGGDCVQRKRCAHAFKEAISATLYFQRHEQDMETDWTSLTAIFTSEWDCQKPDPPCQSCDHFVDLTMFTLEKLIWDSIPAAFGFEGALIRGSGVYRGTMVDVRQATR